MGNYAYIPLSELRRLRGLLDAHRYAGVAVFATACRINLLYMIARAGSGHVGTSFSSVDLVSWLQIRELRNESGAGRFGDVYFSSKGHDIPAYYAIMIALERLPFECLHLLRHLGGLPGHPDVGTPTVVANTGSLGMGISKAKGMTLADGLAGRDSRIYVLTGDGE